MPVQAALLVVLIAVLFARSVWRNPAIASANWLVLAWVAIFASRPVSAWFDPAAVAVTPDTYLEGSPVDRAVFLLLILASWIVLLWRRVSLIEVMSRNRWLFAFYAYCAISVLWSEFPFVAFKRWFKDFGTVGMILILLTDPKPLDAIRTVFFRCACLLVPLSVIFIKYYPYLGRTYTGYSQNELMYTGVATHKNTLGALVLVVCLFVIWDLMFRPVQDDRQRSGTAWIDKIAVLGMALWLLRVANSATSLLCTIVGATVLLGSTITAIRRQYRFIEVYAAIGICLWFLLDSTLGLSTSVVSSLGRDMTLTSRTSIWEVVLDQGVSPVFGAGFKSFWMGDRMARLWVKFPGIIQAHNGYIETYLEGGAVGVLLLGGVLLAGLRKIKRGLVAGERFAPLRLAFWFVVVLYNFSEAAFTQLSLLWIVTLLVIIEGPSLPALPSPMGRPSIPQPGIAPAQNSRSLKSIRPTIVERSDEVGPANPRNGWSTPREAVTA